jgi:Ran GTPase-activating protein (RanGAP) involved in mRNA processing and transport
VIDACGLRSRLLSTASSATAPLSWVCVASDQRRRYTRLPPTERNQLQPTLSIPSSITNDKPDPRISPLSAATMPDPAISPPSGATPSGVHFSVPPLPASATARKRLGRAEATQLFARLAAAPYTSAALGGCTIGDGGAGAVAEQLRLLAARASLRALSLADVVATLPEKEAVRSLSALATAAAAAAPTLTSLDLSYNALGSKGVSACAPLLQALAPTLQELYLRRSGLGPDAARLLRTFLVNTQAGTTLRTLHITSSVLTSQGVFHVAAVLEKSPRIEDLRLSSLRAGADSIARVFSALASRATHLRALDLSDNDMSVDTALLFYNVVIANPGLVRLVLRDMAMGNDCAYLVLRAVTKSPVTLTHLDLAGNELSADSSDAFAACFDAKSSTLVELDLSDNPLGDDAAIRIGQSLNGDRATSLSVVKFALCGLSDLGVVSIADSARSLPALSRLDLGDADLRKSTATAVRAALGDKLRLPQRNDDEFLAEGSAKEAESAAQNDAELELSGALAKLAAPRQHQSPATARPVSVTSETMLSSTTSTGSLWSRFGWGLGGDRNAPGASVEPELAAALLGPATPRTPTNVRAEGSPYAGATPASSQKSSAMVSSARQLRAQVFSLDREVGELMQELQFGEPGVDSSFASQGSRSYFSATSNVLASAIRRESKGLAAELLDIFWACLLALFFIMVVVAIVQSQDELTFSLRPV